MSNFLSGMSRPVETLWNAAINFCLAGAFLMVWSGSHIFGPKAPRQFVFIIVMELILLLCGITLAGIVIADKEQGKLRTSLLVAVGFLVSIGAMSLAGQTWWAFAAAVMLVASRLRILFHVSFEQEEEQRRLVACSLGRLLLLFVLFWAIALLPIPAWGVKSLGRDPAIFTKFPQRALVMGLVYFGLLGIFGVVTCFESIVRTREQREAEDRTRKTNEGPTTDSTVPSEGAPSDVQ